MSNLPQKLNKDYKEVASFMEELSRKVIKGDEQAEELLAKFLGYWGAKFEFNANMIEKTAESVELDPENQRRLTEVMQIRNMLMDNIIKYQKLLIDLKKINKQEEQPNVKVEINIMTPKEEKIEDYIDVLPEEEL